MTNLKHYIKSIKTYTKEELEEEERKLRNVLHSVYNEYLDRKETIHLLSRQLEEVNNLKVTSYDKDPLI